MSYAAGDRIPCPACNNESLVQERTRMDGWEAVGTDLVCALCGAVLESADAEGEQAPSADHQTQDSALERSAALAFLGDEEEGREGPEILDDGEEARFCRDCNNYVRHPFGARCSVWDCEVEPMRDCDRFERRKG